MQTHDTFDVIVIGGGHAGTEAALAAARMGARTLLLTHNIDTLGQMSCNPAIGGIGKGHLVKEIDAMGGLMARAADHAGIQFRTLNARKGPAVRATRAQIDRSLYKNYVRHALENDGQGRPNAAGGTTPVAVQPNLSIFQQAADDLMVENDRVTGVVTQMGLKFAARAVVLTVGTFLGGRIHIGESNYSGGRAGCPPANALSQRLRELPLNVERLKTGTPPRIDGRSIDYTDLESQPGDDPVPVFSFMGKAEQHPQQLACHITYTNERTHDIIAGGLDRSPMYSGVIEGVGPRYCPSIEDKVVRFAERDAHQIFIEPEGLSTHEIYPNGISTSLPFDVQYELVRSIKGFENAHITRPGYAIEYDYFDPRDLRSSLETKYIDSLFFAGQINGTTGYEEAAAQGMLAGINAVNKIREQEAWSPKRDEAYLGVLVDDLITCGTNEPYRMFTSRAEYRLMLREDNADLRLTETAHRLGLVDEQQWRAFNEKREAIEEEQQRLRDTVIQPSTISEEQANDVIGQALNKEARLDELLKRPDVTYQKLMTLPAAGPAVASKKVAEQVEVQIKYAGYIDRQRDEISRQQRHANTELPDDMDYANVQGLSTEVRQKFTDTRPATIGQAARIPGVTPAAISLLLVHLKKKRA